MGSAFNQVGAVRESDARGLAPTADLCGLWRDLGLGLQSVRSASRMLADSLRPQTFTLWVTEASRSVRSASRMLADSPRPQTLLDGAANTVIYHAFAMRGIIK